MFKYSDIKINGFMGTEYSYVSQSFGLIRLLDEVVSMMKEIYDGETVRTLIKTYELNSPNRKGELGKTVTIRVTEDEVLVDFEEGGTKELGLVTLDSIVNMERKHFLEFDVYEYNTPN